MTAPGIELDVIRNAGDWPADAEDLAARAALAAMSATLIETGASIRFPHGVELCVVLNDDEAVRAMNRDYRGQDKATNVLSFASLDEDGPSPEGEPILLGDVVLAFETTAREAAEEGKTLADHLAHLVVHGILHLLGHDHQNDVEAEAMERIETAVLSGLGIRDPHAPQIDSER